MRRALVLLAALGMAGFAVSSAEAFTYDQHLYKNADGSTNFQDPDSSSSSSGLRFGLTGGGAADASPSSRLFLQSSNPAESSPVVSYDGGAASTLPFPMTVH